MYIGINGREYGGGTAWDRVEMGQCPLTPPTQDVQVNWIIGSLPAYDLFIMSFLPMHLSACKLNYTYFCVVALLQDLLN